MNKLYLDNSDYMMLQDTLESVRHIRKKRMELYEFIENMSGQLHLVESELQCILEQIESKNTQK